MNVTTMTDNVSLEDLLAAEEASRTLVMQRYQPTLIAVTLLLVFLCVAGFIGNALVIYTIGRRELPGLFGCLTKCFLTIFRCCLWCFCCRCGTKQQSDSMVHSTPSNFGKPDRSYLSSSFRRIHWLRNQSTSPGTRRTTFAEVRGETSITNISMDETRRKASKITIHRATANRCYTLEKHNSNSLIFLLAFNDFIICTLDIPATIFFIIWEQGTFDVVCRLHTMLKVLMLSVSVLLLLLIAVDRWLIVCFVPSIRIPRSTLFFFVGLCYIGGLGWAIPYGLHHGVPSRFEFSAVDQLVRLHPGLNANMSTTVRATMIRGARVIRTDHIPPKFVATLHEDDSLLKALANYGTCQVDDRYISRSQYREYMMAVLIFFALVFTLICFIYGSIFTFVWWHQRRWRAKFNRNGTQIDRREIPRITRRLSSIRETESVPYAPKDSSLRGMTSIQRHNSCTIEPNAYNCVEKEKSTRDISQRVIRTQRSLSDSSNKDFISPIQVPTVSEIYPVKAHPFVKPTYSLQSDKSSRISQGPIANQTTARNSTHKACWTERKHKLRDSVRNRPVTHRQVKAANRHLRTAVMFILITVTFLVSYLPSLLISNGLMWQVEWETLNGIETSVFSYYDEASSVLATSLRGIDPTLLHNCTRGGSIIRSSQPCAALFSAHEPLVPARSELMHHFRRLLYFLYFVNTVTNPVIYFFLNLKFRGELRQLFHRNPVSQMDGR